MSKQDGNKKMLNLILPIKYINIITFIGGVQREGSCTYESGKINKYKYLDGLGRLGNRYTSIRVYYISAFTNSTEKYTSELSRWLGTYYCRVKIRSLSRDL